MTLMTKNEFLQYAQEMIYGEGSECLYERKAEIQNEINMFGDSGPGTMYHLQIAVNEYNGMVRQFNRMTGSDVKPMSMPYYNSSRYEHDEEQGCF